MHFLIFANGDVNDGPMVRCALSTAHDARIVAADGGARVARHFGLAIDILIGDMDSVDSAQLAVHGVDVRRYPPEKDETDLELALMLAAEEGAEWIRVIGGVGDRLDQTLANVYLLALPILASCDVRMVAGKQEVRLLRPGEHQMNGSVGDTVSLIPLGGAASGVQTENLRYPLRDETLEFGPARGISNVMQANSALIRLNDGMLLLVHTVGRA